jgi:hypothetical protein
MSGTGDMVREKHAEKLAWLGKLSEFNPKHELRVATTIDGRRIGRWFPFKDWLDISYIDHVTALPNECVWEIDHDDWNFVKKHGENIIEALDRFEVPHVQGVTSGRGVHIHSYFTLPEKSLRKKLDDYGVLPRELRLALFGMICREARIPQTMVGKGLPFDTGCVDFSDMSMGHMVRAFGGRKFENGTVVGHKGFVTEIPDERTRIQKFCDVKIPERIVSYSIPKEIIDDLLAQTEIRKQDALKNRTRVCDGLYLNAPCVKALIAEGRPKGDRYRGAQVVAIACRLSGLCYEAALEVAQEYYSNCDKGDFSFFEVEGWLKWAYSRELEWWCSQVIPFRNCQPHICPVAEKHFSEKPKVSNSNPVWLRKWQRAPTVGWMERKRQEV